jgi:hypothetical protein
MSDKTDVPFEVWAKGTLRELSGKSTPADEAIEPSTPGGDSNIPGPGILTKSELITLNLLLVEARELESRLQAVNNRAEEIAARLAEYLPKNRWISVSEKCVVRVGSSIQAERYNFEFAWVEDLDKLRPDPE